MRRYIDDQTVLAEVIEPGGGVGRFRLIRFPGNKAIQYAGSDGTMLDLLIEESELAAAAVAFLERAGVPEIDWRDRESARAGAPGKKS